MLGLIYKYILDPSQKNADRVRIYAQKHPFSIMMIPREMQEQYGHLWQGK